MPYISNIVKNIDKSILVIGPQILFDNEGKSVVEGFTEEYFRRNGDLIESYSSSDYLIRPKDETAEGTIQQDFAEFYEIDFPEKVKSLYQEISKIPFPLVISLNPDATLKACLEEMNIRPYFDFFSTGRKNTDNETPTKDKPLLYNLTGCYSDPQSLVLTYDKMYDYLKNIFHAKSIPTNIRFKLQEAKYIIFLGVQFGAWYFQLLINILTENMENAKSNKGSKSTRYAAPDLSGQESIRELYIKNFKIYFVGPQIENFITELSYKCFEQKLLRGQLELTEDKIFNPEIFISYKRVPGSEDIVDQLIELSVSNNYHVVFDKKDLKYKEKIRLFMDRIGWGKYIISVIGNEYLRSPFCMYELLEINRKGDLIERLFPIIINYDIFTESYRVDLDEHWEKVINELRNHLKDYSTLTDINETVSKIQLYEEIRTTIPEILKTLNKRNFLSLEIHKQENFSSLFDAIKRQKEKDIRFL